MNYNVDSVSLDGMAGDGHEFFVLLAAKRGEVRA